MKETVTVFHKGTRDVPGGFRRSPQEGRFGWDLDTKSRRILAGRRS